MQFTASTSSSGGPSPILGVVEMDAKFYLSSTSIDHGTVFTEEVPEIIHAVGVS
jgi:hypothetical protein